MYATTYFPAYTPGFIPCTTTQCSRSSVSIPAGSPYADEVTGCLQSVVNSGCCTKCLDELAIGVESNQVGFDNELASGDPPWGSILTWRDFWALLGEQILSLGIDGAWAVACLAEEVDLSADFRFWGGDACTLAFSCLRVVEGWVDGLLGKDSSKLCVYCSSESHDSHIGNPMFRWAYITHSNSMVPCLLCCFNAPVALKTTVRVACCCNFAACPWVC